MENFVRNLELDREIPAEVFKEFFIKLFLDSVGAERVKLVELRNNKVVLPTPMGFILSEDRDIVFDNWSSFRELFVKDLYFKLRAVFDQETKTLYLDADSVRSNRYNI